MAGKLVISRLVQDELTYECQVRGIGSGTVEEMRKSLAKAIRMENEGTTLPIPTYPYTFEEDMLAIRTKIEPIETGIAALTTSKSNKHIKLETTLNHLLGRLKRSKPQNDDEIKERSEVLGKILALMTDLDNRCEEIEKQQQIVPAELSILENRMPRHSSFEQDFGDGDEEENEVSPPIFDRTAVSQTLARVHAKSMPVYKWGLQFSGGKQGGKNGFIPGALTIFRSGTKSGDYHDEMNASNFLKWRQAHDYKALF
ncbi:hypothetical protein RN001_002942 [Aquatica leii]|uniref:Uncharacterized protein n=1 Tax=Aquatica leii TaxID=1421715 RepID=A0AAN7PQH9_9COLE|nr:hypothetical protein RN001_002942 [Aquatica leii]